jgi:hypothetical protein
VGIFGFHKGDEKFMACSSSLSGVDPVIDLSQFLVKISSEKLHERDEDGRRIN